MSILRPRKEVPCFGWLLACLILRPWSWRWYVETDSLNNLRISHLQNLCLWWQWSKTDRAVYQVTSCWFLTAEPRVHFTCGFIWDSWFTKWYLNMFFSYPLQFSLLIIIPSLLNSHLSPLPEVYDSPNQVGHCNILGPFVRSFISNTIIGYWKDYEVSFFKTKKNMV